MSVLSQNETVSDHNQFALRHGISMNNVFVNVEECTDDTAIVDANRVERVFHLKPFLVLGLV